MSWLRQQRGGLTTQAQGLPGRIPQAGPPASTSWNKWTQRDGGRQGCGRYWARRRQHEQAAWGSWLRALHQGKHQRQVYPSQLYFAWTNIAEFSFPVQTTAGIELVLTSKLTGSGDTPPLFKISSLLVSGD